MDCKICFEKYNKSFGKPYVLNCGHSMCLSCLTKIKLAGSNCPTCRKPITDEKPNYDLIEILDMNLIVDPCSELRKNISNHIKELEETKRQFLLECGNKKKEISKNSSEIKLGVEKRTTELLNHILLQQEALNNETEIIRKNLNEKVDALSRIDYPNPDGIDKMEWAELQSLKEKLIKAKKELESSKSKINQIDACFVLKKDEKDLSSIGRIMFLKSEISTLSAKLMQIDAKLMQTTCGINDLTKILPSESHHYRGASSKNSFDQSYLNSLRVEKFDSHASKSDTIFGSFSQNTAKYFSKTDMLGLFKPQNASQSSIVPVEQRTSSSNIFCNVQGQQASQSSPFFGSVGHSQSTSSSDIFRNVQGQQASQSSPFFGSVGHSQSTSNYNVFGGVQGQQASQSSPFFGSVGQSQSTSNSNVFGGVQGQQASQSSPFFGSVGHSQSTSNYNVFGGVQGQQASQSLPFFGSVGQSQSTSISSFRISGSSPAPNSKPDN